MMEIVPWSLPLVGFCLALLLPKKRLKLLSFLTLSLAFVSSVYLLLISYPVTGFYFNLNWIPELNVKPSFYFDDVSLLFSSVILLIGAIITTYSFGYIKVGLRRYYSLLLLFIGSMVGLVLSSNLFVLFVFWEIVGICSYLLIGFWYKKEKAAMGGMKAFLMTKFGDVALLAAIILLFVQFGTFSLQRVTELSLPVHLETIVPILLLIGILTKSAQFPFHVWLPDAMEGPSTVSALLHSATMVKAGVYLFLRFYPIFPSQMLELILDLSLITIFVSSFLALTGKDIKRILAFSTISQIGFMMFAISIMNPLSSFYHLINHAFFKALLFLVAGNVIHAVGSRSIKDIRIVRFSMPLTSVGFLIGFLALIGFTPLNGFWSKEMILNTIVGRPFLFASIIVASFMTVLYSFRVLFRMFFGSGRREYFEFNRWMTYSPLFLAGICVVLGFVEPFGLEFELSSTVYSLVSIGVGFMIARTFFFGKGVEFEAPSLIREFFSREFLFDDLFIGLSKLTAGLSRSLYGVEVRVNSLLDGAFPKIFIGTSKLVHRFESMGNEALDNFIPALMTSLSRLVYKTEDAFNNLTDNVLIEKFKNLYVAFRYLAVTNLNVSAFIVATGLILLLLMTMVL